jgi:hypothetical protein
MKWRVPAYIALAVIAIYWFGKWSERQGHESGEAIARAEVSLRLHKAFEVQQAKLRAISHAHATAARVETVHLIQIAPTLSAPQLRIHIEALSRDWEAAFRAESLRADFAVARANDLELNTAALLRVADCHMLGVHFLPRCPSRTVSAAVGAGVGAVIVLVARR